jgi:hypothetical protein
MLRPWKATPFLPLALRARIGEVSRASHWSITLGHFRIQQISRHFEGERESRGGKIFHRGTFLRQTFLNELAFALGQWSLEQPPVAADVIAVRSQKRKLLINHRRRPFDV